MLFLCCFDARNDEFDRQRGEIAWSLNNCLIISGTCNIIYGMIYFKFILVPVFIAYFLTFLMAPVMMLLEGAIYTDFHCSRLFCDYLSARLWVYLDGPIWMGLFGWVYLGGQRARASSTTRSVFDGRILISHSKILIS